MGSVAFADMETPPTSTVFEPSAAGSPLPRSTDPAKEEAALRNFTPSSQLLVTDQHR